MGGDGGVNYTKMNNSENRILNTDAMDGFHGLDHLNNADHMTSSPLCSRQSSLDMDEDSTDAIANGNGNFFMQNLRPAGFTPRGNSLDANSVGSSFISPRAPERSISDDFNLATEAEAVKTQAGTPRFLEKRNTAPSRNVSSVRNRSIVFDNVPTTPPPTTMLAAAPRNTISPSQPTSLTMTLPVQTFTAEQLVNKKMDWMKRMNVFTTEHDMSCSEFNSLVQLTNNIRFANGGDSTHYHCLCPSFETKTKCTHCMHKNPNTYKKERSRVFEPESSLDPVEPLSQSQNKWTPQIRFTDNAIQNQITTGTCNYKCKQLKQLIIFLQLYGDSKFPNKKRKKPNQKISIHSFTQAKKGLVSFGLESTYYIDVWAPKLVHRFVERLGGVDKMVEATRIFFSNTMLATAARLLKISGFDESCWSTSTSTSTSMSTSSSASLSASLSPTSTQSFGMQGMQRGLNFSNEDALMPSNTVSSSMSNVTDSQFNEHIVMVQDRVRSYCNEWNADNHSSLSLDYDWMQNNMLPFENMQLENVQRNCRVTHFHAILAADIEDKQRASLTRAVTNFALEEVKKNNFKEHESTGSPLRKKSRSNSMRSSFDDDLEI